GKSSWYHALASPGNVRERIGLHRALEPGKLHARPGFGNEKAYDEHPDADILTSILADGIPASTIWKTIVLWHATGPAGLLAGFQGWGEKAAWVRDNPEVVARALQEADDQLSAQGITLLILFDALDRTADSWDVRRELLRELLKLLLDLKGYRSLRGKAFVRPDMLEYGNVLQFTDSSKVVARAVTLDWRPADLYRLLWQRMGNAHIDEAAWFRRRTPGDWDQEQGIFVPPASLVQSDDAQRQLFHEITGPYMGRNHRRGYPYTWLPKHLADSQQQISPRSFLLALRAATEKTNYERYEYEWPLHFDAIKEGVQEASKTRVAEIKEDVPWIDVALSPLEGLSVPCASDDIDERWRSNETIAKLGALAPEDQPQRVDHGARGLREELVALGILDDIGAERFNMADVYRVAFRLGRKGGVKPLN
ncbi:MAG: hypothetical protein Q7T55_26400, partial [Solirubrobacteraceae bacterium]|nr:hypothetical protein [Solirubrobacteraceae bacterium]